MADADRGAALDRLAVHLGEARQFGAASARPAARLAGRQFRPGAVLRGLFPAEVERALADRAGRVAVAGGR
ncbi:hypothetical protein [Actinomadura sp. WMMB 499]|uniref:hypothetical protein n=1 Tax=Actinomadura sp. WMMB 499 TaxID=1219491 RepID=UPI00124445EF|nr:hypothetical protein [Actinomadura sp. WMMB 499]QFG26719.1 hypothetical protein F7P10_41865 [Actinomadura sp. WMMB 499]